ncbi:MAG: hypothetical protein IKD72_02265 [Clostridia bacterium]|nr:hypothetical protein [Clostridia bacterium]
MKDVYRFADAVVAVESLYPAVHDYCRAYRFDGAPELTVRITPADLTAERQKSAAEDRAEGRAVRDFADDYLEILAVYRKLAEWAPLRETVLLHGSAVAVDGAAYLFTAKSGVGKSTHAALWQAAFGSRAVIINDDKPLLRITQDGVTVFGTPWDGKHRRSANCAAPLRALCILERAAQTQVIPISASQAMPLLLQQIYRPADPAALAATLRLLDRLTQTVPLYRMGCNMAPSAAVIAYEAMKG